MPRPAGATRGRLAAALRRCPRGAAALEFAVAANLLFIVLLGILEFGWLFYIRGALQQTAAAAARCMGVLGAACTSGGVVSPALTQSYVQSVAASYDVSVPVSGITLNADASCGGVSGFSEVALSYTFQSGVGVIVPGLVGGLTVSVQSCYPNQG
jgi:Flp pilus assembly protein TadG